MTYIINQIILAAFNLVNSRIDAHRILRHKTIAHGINLGAYLLVAGFLAYKQLCGNWSADWNDRWIAILNAVYFLFAAFFNRQLSFDIPLNLRRGKPWDHQSTAVKPKAVMDRLERWLFGDMDGKYIAGIYAVGFLLITFKMTLF